MKKKIILSQLVFVSSLIGVALTCLTQGGTSATVGFVLVSFGSVLFMSVSWMRYVASLVAQSNKTLNKSDQQVSTLTFDNLTKLQQNHELVSKKFEVSAELIANLSNPEKAGTTDDLISSDPIGKALQNIRTEMLRIKDEDDKRAWISQGLATFSEILRNKADVKEYSYSIISQLVKYIHANQGGLFIEYTNPEGERYLEMTGCYAYEKRRYSEAQVFEGAGLLGQCMLEKDFIYITDVPKDYVKITSGLGLATPRNIVVAPLIFNETFCGAIELASFEILKPHQMEFLKKVCENIASEIAAIKSIQQTQQLLQESNTLAQELQSREEEMKQSMEELAATQEEMARKQSELAGIINAIDSTLATAEFDIHGRLKKCNAILERFFGYDENQLIGKDYTLLMNGDEAISWFEIIDGKMQAGDFKTRTKTGTDLWLSITFTVILNSNNQPEKVLCMIQDITQKKLREKEFERLSLVANNTDNSVIITNADGITEYVNAGFTKMTGYEPHHVIGKKPGDLLQGPLTDVNTIEKLRIKMDEGVPIYEEILNYNKKGETYWVSLAINPVKDEGGKIIRFISIQADITQTKIEALDFHQKMEALSRANAIIELDTHGVIIEINDNYLQLLGYERQEVIGQNYTFLTHKENVFHKMLETIREKKLQSGEYSRYDKQGRRHYLKLMDYPVLNFNGQIEKIIEFGVDVTNEKRLLHEAERKQAELNSYLEGINNTIASAEFDLNGKFKTANDIFLKVMGYHDEELSDKHFNFFMGDDQAVIMMWENLRLGKFFSGEFKMRDKSGKELWLTGTFNPILVEGNAPEKIMMFAQFTTQEKEKLIDLNAMVHALKATLPVIEFTEHFACKTANEKALKIFGVSRMELKNKTILDFIEPFYHATWEKKLKEVLENEFSNFILPVVAGKEAVTYEVSFSVLRNLEGKVAKIIVLFVKEVPERISVLASA